MKNTTDIYELINELERFNATTMRPLASTIRTIVAERDAARAEVGEAIVKIRTIVAERDVARAEARRLRVQLEQALKAVLSTAQVIDEVEAGDLKAPPPEKLIATRAWVNERIVILPELQRRIDVLENAAAPRGPKFQPEYEGGV